MTLLTITPEYHMIWTNVFFYLFIFSLIIIGIIIRIGYLRLFDKNKELKQTQQQYTAKIDSLRKDHAETLERVRNEMLKKEEERTRQWMESEKETLHVLNGISQILELSENLSKLESKKILSKLDEIKDIVKNKNS